MYQFDLFIENHILPISTIINKRQNRKPDGKRNPEYTKIYNQIKTLNNKLSNKNTNIIELKSIKKQIQILKVTKLNIPYSIKETINIKISYTRYADDWVIFTHGPRHLPTLIFNKIKTWLKQYLSLELSSEKTLITPCNKEWVKFLGFAICIQKTPTRIKYITRQENTFPQRTGYVNVTLDTQRILFKLRNKGFAHQKYPKSIGKKSWTNLEPETIIKSYSSIIYGINNYYSRNITFFRDLNWVHFLIKTSCAKTLCLKYKKNLYQSFSENMVPIYL